MASISAGEASAGEPSWANSDPVSDPISDVLYLRDVVTLDQNLRRREGELVIIFEDHRDLAELVGVRGQRYSLYRQFAVTIAISTVISAINSLTLSPALAATLLKPHGAAREARSGKEGAARSASRRS